MPLQTFFNLPDYKRNKIIDCAIDEFSRNEYRSVLISCIAKKAEVAKGSMYQYFRDKSDLYSYLLDLAGQKKAELLQNSSQPREDRTIFEHLKWLFGEMARFTQIHPKLAQLGYRAIHEKNDLTANVIDQGILSTQKFFTSLIDKGKLKGEIRPEVDTAAAAFVLTAAITELPAYLTRTGKTDSLKDAESIFYQVVEMIQKGISVI